MSATVDPHPLHSPAICELDSRSSDGISVQLLWHRDDGRVTVFVVDSHNEEAFSVEVRSGDRALDVFHHPFAYAAWRCVCAGSADAAHATVATHECG